MFQGEPAFRYGNILQMEPEQVAETVLFDAIDAREKKVLQDCARCAFFDLCYSGCMFHSLKDSKVLEEKDYYCAGYKMYFEHVLRRVYADLVQAARTSGNLALPGRGPIRLPGTSRLADRLQHPEIRGQ